MTHQWNYSFCRNEIVPKHYFCFSATRFKMDAERKRFISYMIYAWGLPFILTLITVILDSTEPLPDWALPGIGTTTYFLKSPEGTTKQIEWTRLIFRNVLNENFIHISDGKLAPFLYFYMIILIIFSANTLLFIVTAFKIRQAQRDISKLTSQEESARHQSHLNNEKDK